MTFTITEHQSELIEDLLERFNFEKVLITMHALDWKWVNTAGEPGHSVPNINRMKHSCRNLLYRAIENNTTGSGGFEARYYAPDGNEIEEETFSLSFVVTQSFTNGDW